MSGSNHMLRLLARPLIRCTLARPAEAGFFGRRRLFPPLPSEVAHDSHGARRRRHEKARQPLGIDRAIGHDLVAMQAADQLTKEGINVDVVDLRTLRPIDVDAITSTVQKTNRAVVLEEGWELSGIGAQVVDYIQRECFDDLDAPVVRVHQADVPMPYAKNLERAAKPDVAKTIAAVKKVMYLEQ